MRSFCMSKIKNKKPGLTWTIAAVSLVSLSQNVHADDMRPEELASIGLAFSSFTGAYLCAIGEMGGCMAISATWLTMALAELGAKMDKAQLDLLKGEATQYLLGGEMSPALEDTILWVRDQFKAQGDDRILDQSDAKIAAAISTL